MSVIDDPFDRFRAHQDIDVSKNLLFPEFFSPNAFATIGTGQQSRQRTKVVFNETMAATIWLKFILMLVAKRKLYKY